MATKAGLVAAALVLVLAAVRIGDEPFWQDERATYDLVSQPTGDVLDDIFTDEANMGPYYLATHAWLAVDDSRGWIRTLSVLGGLASVAALAALAHRWLGGGMAAAAPILLALHPFFLDYLTEARAYSWSMAAVLLASLAVERERVRPVLYGVAMGTACALNAISILFIAAHVIALFVLRIPRPMWRELLAGIGVSLLVFAPFAQVLFVVHGDQASWIPPVSATQVATALRDLAGSNLLAVATAIMLVGFAIGVLRSRRAEFASVMILSSIGVPIVGLVLLSMATPLFVHRFLIAVVPFFVLAATDLIMRSRRPPLALALTVLLLVVGGWRIDQDRPRDDLRPRAQARLAWEAGVQEGSTASIAVASAQR